MQKVLIITVSILMLTGCSGHMQAFFNRPVVEDNIGGKVHTVSLSSDRRTVVVSVEGPNAGKFCAESPPDTATSLTTNFAASFNAKAQSDRAAGEAEAGGKVEDTAKTEVVKLIERTANLDAFRAGVYALCQYHLNGALTGEQLQERFQHLVDSYFNGGKKV